MEPVEYARLIRRRWRVVAACCLVSAVAVWVVTPSSPAERLPEFVAEHTLIRDSDTASAPQALATVALLVKSGEVPRRVARKVGFTREPVLLARTLTVEPDDTLGIVSVKATANGREAASELANAFAEETLAYLGERAQEAREKTNTELLARITKRQATIEDLERQSNAAEAAGRSPALIDAQRDAELRLYTSDLELQQKQADLAPPTAGFVTLEAASPDLATPKGAGFGVPASRPARAAGAAILGILFGALIVFVVERVDPRINLRAVAERAYRLPVVAEVPFSARRRRTDILTVTEPSSGVAESYRALRAALLLMPSNVLGEGAGREPKGNGGAGAGGVAVESILGPTGARSAPRMANGDVAERPGVPHVVLVTSAAPSEGKTSTVANLAASFAETGRSVLVLSCDFRRPSIHEFLGVRQAWGITEVLDGGPDAPKLADVVKDSIVTGVRIATNGSPLDNFGEVAADGRRLVADARRMADVVLIDTAPLLVAHEATELIPAADTVLVACRSGHTTKEDAARARELLTRVGATVTGVVLIGAPEADTGYSTYYHTPPTTHRRGLVPWLLGRPAPSEPTGDEAAPPAQPARKRAVI
ncbi:MAG: hypothetical protein ACRD0N_07605 [Acidimicrobiales bacterium]